MGFSLGKAIGGAVSGFIGSGGNPWGAALGGFSGALDAYQDKAYYNYARNKDIQLWMMQNEYNSPKNQMQRYREAGLNPNLIYGQQNVADSVGRSSMADSADNLGRSNRMLNDYTSRLAQYSGLATQDATRREIDARVEQIHNNVKNANELLPYQKLAMLMQIQQQSADFNSPAWVRNFIGRDASEKVGKAASWLVDGVKNLIGSIHLNGKSILE